MRRFIYGERGGIYIIDLLKTAALLAQAQEFVRELAHRGGTVLFVGTKKQARDTIRDVAEAAGMPYVNHRWLGGLLTNFQTISLRIRRLHDLERYAAEGQLELLPTRERMAAQADLVKLRANLGGVKDMQRVPDAMFVIDLKTELIAVRAPPQRPQRRPPPRTPSRGRPRKPRRRRHPSPPNPQKQRRPNPRLRRPPSRRRRRPRPNPPRPNPPRPNPPKRPRQRLSRPSRV